MAVYTHIDAATLDAFLERYDIGRARALTPITEGVENSNYRLETDAGRFVLTIFEKRVQSDDLPFFLELKAHLVDRALKCPRPIADATGATLQKLAGKPAAIVTFLDGRPVETVRPPHVRAVGAALGDLHLKTADFDRTRTNDLSVEGWRRLFDACVEAHDAPTDLLTLSGGSLSRLEAAWPQGLPRGIIHADLFPDNVLFEDDEISGLIDFYFSCTDFLAYDLAVTLNAWCFENGVFSRPCADALIEGYETRRRLTDDERAALPLLAEGAALRFFLTRFYDQLHPVENAVVVMKDPLEYADKLRFHAGKQTLADYGLQDIT